jgi:hypothetical protein
MKSFPQFFAPLCHVYSKISTIVCRLNVTCCAGWTQGLMYRLRYRFGAPTGIYLDYNSTYASINQLLISLKSFKSHVCLVKYMTRNHVKNHHFPMVSYGYSMLTPSKNTHFRLTFGRVYSDSPAGLGSRWSSPVPPLKRKVPWPIRAMRRSTAQSMRYGDMLYIYTYHIYMYVIWYIVYMMCIYIWYIYIWCIYVYIYICIHIHHYHQIMIISYWSH